MSNRSKLEYELKQGKDSQFYVTIRAAGNREALATSEGYGAKPDALHMIGLVRAGAADGVIDDQTDGA